MTPKEKAKELVNSFLYLQDDNFGIDYAKLCALIAVKNEYHSLRELLFNLRSCGMVQYEKVYLVRLQNLIDEEKEIIKETENL